MLNGPDLSFDVLRGFMLGGAMGAAIYCALFLSLGIDLQARPRPSHFSM